MSFTTNENTDLTDLNSPQSIDMSGMFKNCTSLTTVNFGCNYTFFVDGCSYKFSHKELNILKSAISNFTFEDKDIPRLRKITSTYLYKFHAEELL